MRVAVFYSERVEAQIKDLTEKSEKKKIEVCLSQQSRER